MAIRDLPRAERPRERLYWNGAEALADAELLALQLGSGTPRRSAAGLAREMLATYGALAGGGGRGPGGAGGGGRGAPGRGVRAQPQAPGPDARRARGAVGARRRLRGVRAAPGGSAAGGGPGRAARRPAT